MIGMRIRGVVMPMVLFVIMMMVPVPMVVPIIVPVPMVVIMVMIVPVIMVMPVPMVMIVRMNRRPLDAMQFAERLVAARTVAIALAWAILRSPADALDMVVMAFLRRANLGLEAQNLFAVLAHLAVHHRIALDDLGEPLVERIEHQRMVV